MGLIYLRERYTWHEAALVTGLSKGKVSYFAGRMNNILKYGDLSIILTGSSIVELVQRFYNNPNFISRRKIDITRWVMPANDQLALEIVGNNFPVKSQSLDGFLSLNDFIKKFKEEISQTLVKQTLERLADEIIYGPGEQVVYGCRKSVVVYSADQMREFIKSKNVLIKKERFWNRPQIARYLTDHCADNVSASRINVLVPMIVKMNSGLSEDKIIPIITRPDGRSRTLYQPNQRFLDALLQANATYKSRIKPVRVK